ncbi:MAG: rhodanese-like domain-containing protein [Gammaproteobacteria bacterium]
MRLTLTLFQLTLLLVMPLLSIANDNVLIIDVRTEQEWDNGHLESAIHIPLGEISTQIESLLQYKDSEIFLYCGAGRRAEEARKILSNAGFTNLINAGGINDASKLLNSQIVN